MKSILHSRRINIEHFRDELVEVAKTSPALAVSTLSFFGLLLVDWVYILTGIYLIIQIALAIRKHIHFSKRQQDCPDEK